MITYSQPPVRFLRYKGSYIASFISRKNTNVDSKTVDSFGEEWSKFSCFTDEEIKNVGDQYFDIVTEKMINADTVALDVGCGTARWSKYLAPKVKFIEAIDPSKAVFSAINMTKDINNVRITQADTDSIPFNNNTFDFVFSLGVLHHIPDTEKALKKSVEKLKKGGYFLLYLYYNFDNRGGFYKYIFRLSNILRKIISKFPLGLKKTTCDLIAIFIYLPLISLSIILNRLFRSKNWYSKVPLSYYENKSFHIIRNDSLDRFGTPLEKRFTKVQIEEIMKNAGLEEIIFSNNAPYWHAVGKKI